MKRRNTILRIGPLEIGLYFDPLGVWPVFQIGQCWDVFSPLAPGTNIGGVWRRGWFVHLKYFHIGIRNDRGKLREYSGPLSEVHGARKSL